MTNKYNLKTGSTFNYAGQSQTVVSVKEDCIIFKSDAGRKMELSFAHFDVSVFYYGFIKDINA